MSRSSRAIKSRREDEPAGGGGWQGMGERAPSVMRPEEPATGRVIALASLFPLTLGVASLLFAWWGRGYLITPAWGVLLAVVGVGGLLYHAFNEKDLQYRRLYGLVGVLLLALGVLFRLLPGEVGGLGGQTFLQYGAPSLLLALGFLLSFVRNETDAALRRLVLNTLGVIGGACAVLGLVGGLVSESFMIGHGVVLLALGLLYLAAYVGMQGIASDQAYWVGLGIGAFGVVMIALAVGLSLVPQLLFEFGWLEARPVGDFFVPRGLLLLYLGLEYLMLSVGICSDAKFVVQARRELAGFFYSPIAYIVLISMAVLGWFTFDRFVGTLWALSARGGLPEPIVRYFTFGLIPVFFVIFAVPLLTMRLLSEEYRTGSLEVLLTAPVSETAVVLAKFFAAWRVFLLAWYPWGVYLLALYAETGQAFDFRPVLTFFFVMMLMSAGWVAMGLFFSSLTRNQIAAGILTLVGMIALTFVHIIRGAIEDASPTWSNILLYVSYIDHWVEASGGIIAPRYLVFHISAAIFWLFLTVKVMEARKWS